MINLAIKCPHCDAPVEARYMPPTSIDHIPSMVFDTGGGEDFEIEPSCNLCVKSLDNDAMLIQARAEYDRLLSGIVSDL